MANKPTIPIRPATDAALSACQGAEPFALIVLGDSMLPEFAEGDVIIVEPEGHATDGSFVLAHHEGEWLFRQLVRGDASWELRALDSSHAPICLAGLDAVRGVIIQKSRPGRRSERKLYGQA
jgi:DNA polymerase V